MNRQTHNQNFTRRALRRTLKPIATALVALLAYESAGAPLAQASAFSVNPKAPFTAPLASQNTIAHLPKAAVNFTVANSVGALVESYRPAGASRVVYHLQDVHDYVPAQTNLYDIVSHLSEYSKQRGKTLVVAVEGLYDTVDTDRLIKAADSQTREEVGDALLKVGFLNGEELAALKSNVGEIKLVGIEDRKLHAINNQARSESIEAREHVLVTIRQIKGQLVLLRQHNFNPAMETIEASRYKAEAGDLPLADYLKLLAKANPEAARALPGVSQALALTASEKNINFDKVEKDTKALVTELMARKSESDVQQMVADAAAMKEGKMPASSYYSSLLAQTGHRYPVLEDYLAYLRRSESLNADALFDEIEVLEKAVAQKEIRHPIAMSLYENLRWVERQEKFFSLTMIPHEWDQQRNISVREIFAMQNQIQSFVKEQVQDLGYNFEAPYFSLADLEPAVAGAAGFYRAAEAREHKMVSNLEKVLAQYPADKYEIALIAGGFHTPGLTKKLKEKGLGYVVVRPQLDTEVELNERFIPQSLRRAPAETDRPTDELGLPGGQEVTGKMLQDVGPNENEVRSAIGQLAAAHEAAEKQGEGVVSKADQIEIARNALGEKEEAPKTDNPSDPSQGGGGTMLSGIFGLGGLGGARKVIFAQTPQPKVPAENVWDFSTYLTIGVVILILVVAIAAVVRAYLEYRRSEQDGQTFGGPNRFGIGGAGLQGGRPIEDRIPGKPVWAGGVGQLSDIRNPADEDLLEALDRNARRDAGIDLGSPAAVAAAHPNELAELRAKGELDEKAFKAAQQYAYILNKLLVIYPGDGGKPSAANGTLLMPSVFVKKGGRGGELDLSRILPPVESGIDRFGLPFTLAVARRLNLLHNGVNLSSYHQAAGQEYAAGQITVPTIDNFAGKMPESAVDLNLDSKSPHKTPPELVARYTQNTLDQFAHARADDLAGRKGEKIAAVTMAAGESDRAKKGSISKLMLQALWDAAPKFVDREKIPENIRQTINIQDDNALALLVRIYVTQARGGDATKSEEAGEFLKSILYSAKALSPMGKLNGKWYNFLEFNVLGVEKANNELDKAGYGRRFVSALMINEKFDKTIRADLERIKKEYGLKDEVVIFYQPLGYAVAATKSDVEWLISEDQKLPQDSRTFKTEQDKKFARDFAEQNAGEVLYELGQKAEGHGWVYPSLLLKTGGVEEPAIVTLRGLNATQIWLHNIDSTVTPDHHYLAANGMKRERGKRVTFEVSNPTNAEKGRGGGAVRVIVDGKLSYRQAEWDIVLATARKIAQETGENVDDILNGLIAETPDSPFNNATSDVDADDAFGELLGPAYAQALGYDDPETRDKALADLVPALIKGMGRVPLIRSEYISDAATEARRPVGRGLLESRAWDIQNAMRPGQVGFIKTNNFEDFPEQDITGLTPDQLAERFGDVQFNPYKGPANLDNAQQQQSRLGKLARVISPNQSLFGLTEAQHFHEEQYQHARPSGAITAAIIFGSIAGGLYGLGKLATANDHSNWALASNTLGIVAAIWAVVILVLVLAYGAVSLVDIRSQRPVVSTLEAARAERGYDTKLAEQARTWINRAQFLGFNRFTVVLAPGIWSDENVSRSTFRLGTKLLAHQPNGLLRVIQRVALHGALAHGIAHFSPVQFSRSDNRFKDSLAYIGNEVIAWSMTPIIFIATLHLYSGTYTVVERPSYLARAFANLEVAQNRHAQNLKLFNRINEIVGDRTAPDLSNFVIDLKGMVMKKDPESAELVEDPELVARLPELLEQAIEADVTLRQVNSGPSAAPKPRIVVTYSGNLPVGTAAQLTAVADRASHSYMAVAFASMDQVQRATDLTDLFVKTGLVKTDPATNRAAEEITLTQTAVFATSDFMGDAPIFAGATPTQPVLNAPLLSLEIYAYTRAPLDEASSMLDNLVALFNTEFKTDLRQLDRIMTMKEQAEILAAIAA